MNNVMFHLQNRTEQIIGSHNAGARADCWRGGDTKTKLITKTELGSVSWWRRKPRGGSREIIAGAWRAAGAGHSRGWRGATQSHRYTLLTSAAAVDIQTKSSPESP